ncbi:hypothetical protein YC2023_113811 [Brassica napus]
MINYYGEDNGLEMEMHSLCCIAMLVWSLILWMIAKYENRKRSRSSRRKEKDRFAITYEAQRTINSSSNFISFGTLFCPNNYVDRTWVHLLRFELLHHSINIIIPKFNYFAMGSSHLNGQETVPASQDESRMQVSGETKTN